jgi:predicted CoA-binding protein
MPLACGSGEDWTELWRRRIAMRSYEQIVRDLVCKPSRVAVVGASPKPERPVSGVMRYLAEQGFVLQPVNPVYEGQVLEGTACRGRLADMPVPVDIVAFFLAAGRQEEMLDQVRSLDYRPVVWFQPGAENPEAEKKLTAEGYEVVSGKCLMALHKARC